MQCPHMRLLPVITGNTGVGLTVTFKVLEELQPVAGSATVTLYTPDAFVCALAIVGFWVVVAKELGPVQLYTKPEVASVAKSDKRLSAQTGPLLERVGTGGVNALTSAKFKMLDTQPVAPEATYTFV